MTVLLLYELYDNVSTSSCFKMMPNTENIEYEKLHACNYAA